MAWEIKAENSRNDVLKEEGPRGRYLFQMWEFPGLGSDAVLIRRTIMAAPDLFSALKALLPEIDSEIEQRQTSGNDEYWQDLKALSDAGHAAVAKVEGR